ncbi:RNA polymerase sigma-70 factor, ECF subfamily protein [Enhygromyxa salina]|uniref:RNA polymerase sigma-70 factor, ECF subfamily protein n=1 Tax=Enhygromyxa salina TaxID=215803 RepID=A0A0C2D717_9BACT|nr:RNA polymerase sigma-70 factor, ECF subfamily protein [Enhygromyxa salina]
MERAQAGDQRAFRELYMLHANTVFRCAIMPLVRDRNLAEDLLADTFVRAMENLRRFTWQGKGLLPWLIRIGKNLCLDHLRKAGRTTAWPEGFEQQIPDVSDSNAESLLGRSELSDALRERIDACMSDLNPRYRHVLELRMFEKRSRQYAAEQLDVTIGTLDVLLFRACKSFRKVYVRRYGTGEEGSEFPAP